jgi:hypothetical protein
MTNPESIYQLESLTFLAEERRNGDAQCLLTPFSPVHVYWEIVPLGNSCQALAIQNPHADSITRNRPYQRCSHPEPPYILPLNEDQRD